MSSIIELLPKVVEEGRKEANKILEAIESNRKVLLQTNEFVIPSKDSNYKELFSKLENNRINSIKNSELSDDDWKNRLIYGDNLLVMQSLLAGDEETGLKSLKNKIDLIYIDPPFDSKADYRTKIEIPGATIDQNPTVIEQFAYSDIWSAKLGEENVRGTLAYLRYMYPRLVLMRESYYQKKALYIFILIGT